MPVLSVAVLAVGLAADATAVAAASGLRAPAARAPQAALLALLFGGFQAAMPAAGYAVGVHAVGRLASLAPMIAFGVLVGIGAHMIYESYKGGGDAPANPFALRVLVPLAVATSIDAFAAGLTLPLFDVALPVAVAIIGVVTAALSFAGVYAGRRFGPLLGRRVDFAGGIVLILLGMKILLLP